MLLAFDKDDNDGVDGETDVAKGNEGGEGDAAVDNGDEGAEANLSVLVENHGDDVAAATGGTAAEYHADGHTVDEAGDDGVEEVVGHEPHAVVGLHHVETFDGVGDDGAVVDDGVVAPHPAFNGVGEAEDEESGDNGLDTELGTEDPRADNEQGDVHTDGPDGDFATPEGAENVGQAVGATRGHEIGVDKHHIAHGKEGAAKNQEHVGNHFLLKVLLFHLEFCYYIVLFYCML